jgi:glycerol-3-phosphate acyltransferase PlsY
MDNKTKWKLYDKYTLLVEIFNDGIYFGLMGVVTTLLIMPLILALSPFQIIYAAVCAVMCIVSIICKIIFQRKRDNIWRMILNDD